MIFFLTKRFVPDGMLGNKLVSGINFYSFFLFTKLVYTTFNIGRGGGE